MFMTKNPYNPDTHKSVGIIFETVIVNSSMKADFDVFLKSFAQNTLPEYESLLEAAYPEACVRARLKAAELGADAIYNVSISIESLYPGTTLLLLTGEGVSST